MKITEWAILFVLVVSPLFWAASLRADNRMEVLLLEQRYNAVLKAAVQDGASRLNINERPAYEAGYASDKFFRVDKQAGLNALLHTLYLNFGIADDPVAQSLFMLYVPAIVVLEYDGYSIYGVQNVLHADSGESIVHTWFPKKPYASTDASGNLLSFTLDQRLTILDKHNSRFYYGRPEELMTQSGDPLLKLPEKLDTVRRTAIVSTIERDLETVISTHNRLAEQAGVRYTFTLPKIQNEDWNNTIDDAGMFVFLQGIPVGDQYYNNFAFGGGRLLKREPVYGGVNEDTGIKYYYISTGCENFRTEETFANERDAAAKGYFEALKVCSK